MLFRPILEYVFEARPPRFRPELVEDAYDVRDYQAALFWSRAVCHSPRQ